MTGLSVPGAGATRPPMETNEISRRFGCQLLGVEQKACLGATGLGPKARPTFITVRTMARNECPAACGTLRILCGFCLKFWSARSHATGSGRKPGWTNAVSMVTQLFPMRSLGVRFRTKIERPLFHRGDGRSRFAGFEAAACGLRDGFSAWAYRPTRTLALQLLTDMSPFFGGAQERPTTSRGIRMQSRGSVCGPLRCRMRSIR